MPGLNGSGAAAAVPPRALSVRVHHCGVKGLNNKQVSQRSLATVCVRSGQLMNELHILDLLWLEQSAILVTLYVICVVCEKNDR